MRNLIALLFTFSICGDSTHGYVGVPVASHQADVVVCAEALTPRLTFGSSLVGKSPRLFPYQTINQSPWKKILYSSFHETDSIFVRTLRFAQVLHAGQSVLTQEKFLLMVRAHFLSEHPFVLQRERGIGWVWAQPSPQGIHRLQQFSDRIGKIVWMREQFSLSFLRSGMWALAGFTHLIMNIYSSFQYSMPVGVVSGVRGVPIEQQRKILAFLWNATYIDCIRAGISHQGANRILGARQMRTPSGMYRSLREFEDYYVQYVNEKNKEIRMGGQRVAFTALYEIFSTNSPKTTPPEQEARALAVLNEFMKVKNASRFEQWLVLNDFNKMMAKTIPNALRPAHKNKVDSFKELWNVQGLRRPQYLTRFVDQLLTFAASENSVETLVSAIELPDRVDDRVKPTPKITLLPHHNDFTVLEVLRLCSRFDLLSAGFKYLWVKRIVGTREHFVGKRYSTLEEFQEDLLSFIVHLTSSGSPQSFYPSVRKLMDDLRLREIHLLDPLVHQRALDLLKAANVMELTKWLKDALDMKEPYAIRTAESIFHYWFSQEGGRILTDLADLAVTQGRRPLSETHTIIFGKFIYDLAKQEFESQRELVVVEEPADSNRRVYYQQPRGRRIALFQAT